MKLSDTRGEISLRRIDYSDSFDRISLDHFGITQAASAFAMPIATHSWQGYLNSDEGKKTSSGNHGRDVGTITEVGILGIPMHTLLFILFLVMYCSSRGKYSWYTLHTLLFILFLVMHRSSSSTAAAAQNTTIK